MQDDQPHAGPDGLGHALHDLVRDLLVGGVAPPKEDVRPREAACGQAVLGLLQGRRGGLDGPVLVQRVGDGLVHALGIDSGDDLVLLLVDVLAPDDGSDGHGAAPRLDGRAYRTRSAAGATGVRARRDRPRRA
jgi:hypothetical protein